MNIEIPIEHIKINGIKSHPFSFEPVLEVIIQKSYINEIDKDYIIKEFKFDYSYIDDYVKNGGYFEGYNLQLKYIIDNFIKETDESTPEYKQKIKLYSENNSFRMPIIASVIKKDSLTIKDATIILAKRYKEMLEPVKGIDDNLNKNSNSNLYWMCTQIIEDELPDDKISRWIGFIQGVMSVKGYIDVDIERDLSRPMFHSVYNNSNIAIPETKELEKTIKSSTDKSTTIRLCYNAWDKNNNISEYRSPYFEATDKNLIFLNFITSIIEYSKENFYSLDKAIPYIKENWNIFENIMKDFSKEYSIEEDFYNDVMTIFDKEILEMLIEYFECNDYVPQEFYDYDAINDVKNPDGFFNGKGVYAYERVE